MSKSKRAGTNDDGRVCVDDSTISSMLITSNLAFSERNKVFKDPVTTAAAIDRVVHHSVILEFAEVKTYRGEAAEKRRAAKGKGIAADADVPGASNNA